MAQNNLIEKEKEDKKHLQIRLFFVFFVRTQMNLRM